MRIDDGPDPGYEPVSIEYVGFLDPYALEGVLVLRSDDGRQFQMRAFPGDVARSIKEFAAGSGPAPDAPSVYRVIEQVCEHAELVLVKAKIYDSGSVLRANLYFSGKGGLVVRNCRASDAVALATFYQIPLLLRATLLQPIEA